jgi:hypothetical protein
LLPATEEIVKQFAGVMWLLTGEVLVAAAFAAIAGMVL